MESVTATNFLPAMSMPWKLLRNRNAVSDGVVRPVHIKLFPTNKCNASCKFCIAKERNRDEELTTAELLAIVRHFHSLGTRAITLGGGGEPTLHPGLDELFALCADLDIQLGIITNGLLWSVKDAIEKSNNHLIWARMSIIDTESGHYDCENVARFARNLPDVAVGVSFTVTPRTNFETAEKISRIIEDSPNGSHVKYVEESMYGAPEMMARLENDLRQFHKSVFQGWEKGTQGSVKCHISKLRPLVNTDGYVYPCCTVGDWGGFSGYKTRHRMCHWKDFSLSTPVFNGSQCKLCYWEDYNVILDGILFPLEHERFV